VSATVARTPYIGLAEYREEDAALFFGRARDIRVVTANVLTVPVSVLYGPPGAGKSSLVRAGVAARLHARADQPVVVFADWHTDPVAGLKQGVAGELTRLSRALAPGALNLELDAFIELTGRDLPAPMVLVLDQFEDYLLHTRPSELTRSFEEQLARAANRRDSPVHFLLVLRDDTLAKLDRLSGRIPVLFNNRLQLERLSWAAAQEAITQPLRVYNEQHPEQPPVQIEPELIDEILGQVRANGAVRLTGLDRPAGRATEHAVEPHQIRVEAPFLQLVLTRIWAEEVGRGSRILRTATLKSLGGAARILQQHFDAVMNVLGSDQREVVARVFRFLVTPSGMTYAYSAEELASYAEVPLEEVGPVLSRLAQADAGILRPVAAPEDGDAASQRYEVAFDILARAALVWRAHYIALGSYRGRDLGRALTALAAAVLLAEVLVQPPSPILFATRGLAILVLSSLILVQIYRWFLRYVSMTGFLSIRAYRSPLIGVALAAMLTTLWYSSTRFTTNGFDWLGRLDRLGFAMYLFTILITCAVGAFAFISMQFVGQLTAARLRSFDAGLYLAFAIWSLLILAAILLELAGLAPRWIGLSELRLVG
jgi:hypothetical protein